MNSQTLLVLFVTLEVGELAPKYFRTHLSTLSFLCTVTIPLLLQQSPPLNTSAVQSPSPRTVPETEAKTTKQINHDECILVNDDQLFQQVYKHSAKVTYCLTNDMK